MVTVHLLPYSFAANKNPDITPHPKYINGIGMLLLLVHFFVDGIANEEP